MAERERNLSPYDSAHAWIAGERSALEFHADSNEDYWLWRSAFEARLRGLLGRFPEPVALQPEVVDVVDCGSYTREHVYFESDQYSTVAAFVLTPKGLAPGERRPGIVAAHGHGRGKADVCGVFESGDDEQFTRSLNYDYASQFAEHGYVVIAPDWRGFGERRSPADWARQGRDPCNVNYMAMGYVGYHLLALQIWDGMRCVDYLQSLPTVDPERLGVAGLSFGGTMTTYLAALEPRLKVACISGYLSTIKGDAITMRGLGNFCGAQYMPGLLTIGDIPEVAGLIADKPLIIEMGEQDTCFVISDAREAYAKLEKIYAAARASDRLTFDHHAGGHVWSGAKSFDWFARWL